MAVPGAKRPREEGGVLAAPSSKRAAAGIHRTSTLEAPTMLLTGALQFATAIEHLLLVVFLPCPGVWPTYACVGGSQVTQTLSTV